VLGGQVPSIITMVLPDDIKSLLVKFGLSIALIFTYPIAMFPVFEIVEDRSLLSYVACIAPPLRAPLALLIHRKVLCSMPCRLKASCVLAASWLTHCRTVGMPHLQLGTILVQSTRIGTAARRTNAALPARRCIICGRPCRQDRPMATACCSIPAGPRHGDCGISLFHPGPPL
jgi:hypothetical protein